MVRDPKHALNLRRYMNTQIASSLLKFYLNKISFTACCAVYYLLWWASGKWPFTGIISLFVTFLRVRRALDWAEIKVTLINVNIVTTIKKKIFHNTSKVTYFQFDTWQSNCIDRYSMDMNFCSWNHIQDLFHLRTIYVCHHYNYFHYFFLAF